MDLSQLVRLARAPAAMRRLPRLARPPAIAAASDDQGIIYRRARAAAMAPMRIERD